MAVRLIERLMHWGRREGETVDTVSPEQRITVHQFFAAQVELAASRLTKAQIVAYYVMDAATQTEYDALVALAPSQAASQALYLERVHATFLLAEDRVPTYSTPAEVRAKLGI